MLTNTRSQSICATSKSPFAPPVTLEGAAAVLFVGLPAVISVPTSTLRWMTVPANGAPPPRRCFVAVLFSYSPGEA